MFTLEQYYGLEWVTPLSWVLSQPDLWFEFSSCRILATQNDESLDLTGGQAEFVTEAGTRYSFPLSGSNFTTQQSGTFRVRADEPGSVGFSPLYLVNTIPVTPLCGMTLYVANTTSMPGTMQEVLPIGLRVQYFPTVPSELFPDESVGGGSVTVAAGAL